MKRDTGWTKPFVPLCFTLKMYTDCELCEKNTVQWKENLQQILRASSISLNRLQNRQNARIESSACGAYFRSKRSVPRRSTRHEHWWTSWSCCTHASGQAGSHLRLQLVHRTSSGFPVSAKTCTKNNSLWCFVLLKNSDIRITKGWNLWPIWRENLRKRVLQKPECP